jgi:hypothetical protein
VRLKKCGSKDQEVPLSDLGPEPGYPGSGLCEIRKVYRILIGKPERKRQLGRPRIK